MAKTPTRKSSRLPRQATKSAELSSGRKRKNCFSEERNAKRNNCAPESAEELPAFEKKIINGRIVDAFCWICHKLGAEKICDVCPRVYHEECIIKKKLDSHASGYCECLQKSIDGRNQNLKWNPVILKEFLKATMLEATKDKKNPNKPNKFERLFRTWPIMDANEVLCEIRDLDSLIDRMNHTPPYQNTNHFFQDVKWIYHNCCIVHGADNHITEAALLLEKNFKQELLDIEACQDCYRAKHSDRNHILVNPNYFTKLCRPPHSIVWAKIRGSPFWPAKCLRVDNGHADVRFFGTHDKSVISLNQVFRFSRDHPEGKNVDKMLKIRDAMQELRAYIRNYEKEKGPFKYGSKKEPIGEVPRRRSKKHQKRRSHRMVSEKEINVRESNEMESNENLPSSSNESESISNTDVVPSSSQTGMINIEDDENSSDEEPKEMKVKPILDLPFISAPKISEGNKKAGYLLDSASPVVCQMTFTADEEIDPRDKNTVVPCVTKTEAIASLIETSDISCLNPTLSSCSNSFAEATQIDAEAFTNLSSTSSSFPIITSTQSAREVSKNHNLQSNETVASVFNNLEVAPTSEESEESRTFQNSEPDNESDDDVQFLNEYETSMTPLPIERRRNSASLTKTFLEILLSNQPGLRKILDDAHYCDVILNTRGLSCGSSDLKNYHFYLLNAVKYVEVIKANYKELQREHKWLKHINMELTEGKEGLKVLSDDLRKLKKDNDELKKENEILKSNEEASELLRLKKENNELRKQEILNRQNEALCKKLMNENEDLKQKLKESVDTRDQKEVLKNVLISAALEKTQTESLSEIKNLVDTVKAKDLVIEDLNIKLKSTEKKLTKYRKTSSSLKKNTLPKNSRVGQKSSHTNAQEINVKDRTDCAAANVQEKGNVKNSTDDQSLAATINQPCSIVLIHQNNTSSMPAPSGTGTLIYETNYVSECVVTPPPADSITERMMNVPVSLTATSNIVHLPPNQPSSSPHKSNKQSKVTEVEVSKSKKKPS